MHSESGMYLYPWEIEDLPAFENAYASLGCTGMAPALSYHQGDVLRARTGRFSPLREAALSFSPRDSLYGRIKPEVIGETARSGTVKALRDWCSKTGRAFSGWVVLLNNASQGRMHPELCVENLFGDRYEYSLCPSQPDVREYAAALLADICEQFCPDSVMIESAGIRPAGSGPVGAIANIRVTPLVQWLWSLCFCPRCMARAAELIPSLNPGALREQVKKLALRIINSELALAGSDDFLAPMLMLEAPDLFHYQYARQLALGEFIGVISRNLREARVEPRLIPGAVPFDIYRTYLEGLSFSVTSGMAGRWMPLVYGAGETYGLVRNAIHLFDPETPVGMAATLHPARYPDKGAFTGAILEAKADGCDTFYFYNYSLASEERLSWVAGVNRVLPA